MLKFHQFIHLEKGPKRTAIIDFLRGNLFHVTNIEIDLFLKRQYVKIEKFMQMATRAKILLDIGESKWRPEINVKRIKNTDYATLLLEVPPIDWTV